jgi:hypothetical protein
MERRHRWLIVAGATWDTAWKLAALYRAARRRDWKWMGPLMVVNSLGLLPMAYIFFIAKDDEQEAD